MYMAEVVRHRLVVEFGRAAVIFLGRAGRDVVRAGEVVVGNRRLVDAAVVLIVRATLVRCLVEGRANKEMRPRYDPFTQISGIAGFSADSTVFLSIGLVPVLRGEVFALQAPEL